VRRANAEASAAGGPPPRASSATPLLESGAASDRDGDTVAEL
jgi:hypothetical protein